MIFGFPYIIGMYSDMDVIYGGRFYTPHTSTSEKGYSCFVAHRCVGLNCHECASFVPQWVADRFVKERTGSKL